MTDAPRDDAVRRVLIVVHTGRQQAREVAAEFIGSLVSRGLTARILASQAEDLGLDHRELGDSLEVVDDAARPGAGCELAAVFGGDGTLLRSVELTWDDGIPLLGVNLGHVGFLAEAEREDGDRIIEAILARTYTVERRMTLDVKVLHGGTEVARTFALNDASVEKAARERMLEVVVEIDGRPVSRYGCDGVVCATPTGSTAYNFSAGGPIVWPEVEALLMVPLSAHALFARPMVASPSSTLAVEVLDHTEGAGVLWCDGRRTVDLPPGARIEVRRGTQIVSLVRLHTEPFADRLVAKFGLSVKGWRGGADADRPGG